LTTAIYEQSRLAGGKVPYTLIREVSENFIHAQFKEIVVSIMDDGNTIRFADQGPGIQEKEKAQQPGFSSAIEPMKKYIRGVGSGFPIVRDYLDDREGTIQIEDNLRTGAVVTISLAGKHSQVVSSTNKDKTEERSSQITSSITSPTSIDVQTAALSLLPLTERERLFVSVLEHEGDLGVTELKNITETPGSTTFNTLKRLEEMGLVQKSSGKKRALTALGHQLANLM